MQTIKVSGTSVVISNGTVTVNGKRIDLDENEKKFTIIVEGNVERLEVDNCETVEVKGKAGTVKTTNGNVQCGDIEGSVSTVNGNVRASKISGGVSTVNGDIN